MTNLEKMVTSTDVVEADFSLADIIYEADPKCEADLFAALGKNEPKTKLTMAYLKEIASVVALQSQSLLEGVLASYGMDHSDYEILLDNDMFGEILTTALATAEKMSARDRAREIAGRMMPRALQSMSQLSVAHGVSATDRIRAAGAIITAAGLKGGTEGGSNMPTVQINIDNSYPMSGVQEREYGGVTIDMEDPEDD